MTLLITTAFVSLCYLIRGHYSKVKKAVRKLDDLLLDIPTSRKANMEKPNAHEMTAIQLVSEFNGFGVHTILSVIRNFPNLYKNFIFTSVAVVDSGAFKGAEEMKNLEEATLATPADTSTWPATWVSPPNAATPSAPTLSRPPRNCARQREHRSVLADEILADVAAPALADAALHPVFQGGEYVFRRETELRQDRHGELDHDRRTAERDRIAARGSLFEHGGHESDFALPLRVLAAGVDGGDELDVAAPAPLRQFVLVHQVVRRSGRRTRR